MPLRYLDPKIDLAFKRVFAEHAHLLKSFLNAVLPLPDDGLIDNLEYLAPEQVPEVPGLFKNSIVDVKCKDTRGRIFIVEMQMLWSTHFEQRIVFSASQAYVKQLRQGQDYSGLQPVYALAISNQVFDRESTEYYHHYKIVNLTQPKKVLKGLEFVFIELPKFKVESVEHKKMRVLWLRFLSEIGGNAQEPDSELKNNSEIAAALKLVEVAAYDESELEIYHSHLDNARVEAILMSDARAEGKAEGEYQSRLTIARKLKQQGCGLALILQVTDLDIKTIEEL